MDMRETYMAEAIALAKKAAKKDEVPVGAVIVRDGRIIARAYNRRETRKNPLAHAEILAIEQAARRLGGWRLSGCTLYVTLEPCPMCAGAIINARIDEVVFGAYDPKAGAFGSLYNLAEGRLNHTPCVTGGVLADEAAGLLKTYFQGKRAASKGANPR
ncbi:MAG: tRNA adenosine(34) deaminase TadA [Christensenellales bacterium]|jgi:tRNA(adenine34) deaminase